MHDAPEKPFHATAGDRPESTPRLYNLIEAPRDFKRIRVHVRAQDKAGGAFDQYAKWDKGGAKIGYYDILNPPRFP